VGLGAIVMLGREHGKPCVTGPKNKDGALSESLACFDVVGRSTAERIIERFVRADVDVVSVLQECKTTFPAKPSFTAFENVELKTVEDSNSAIQQKLREYARDGIEHSFLLFGNIYAETDLLDLFYFHREARQIATRAINRDGTLDLWVLDCRRAQDSDVEELLSESKTSSSSYFIREYVNRMTQPRDVRVFATDLLKGHCMARPSGREVKRGIWIDDGAEVHRWARIVAPAYIGRGSKIMEDTLITRCSNVEKDCCVDYGTVIEDSSILQNTEVGICLDVCHAIANGNRLLSLDRDVVVEISDPAVMRSSSALRNSMKERKWPKNILLFGHRKPEKANLPEVKPAPSAPKQRGLKTNSLQG
jgi:carbonic anhydrase/acetyltransferase-like protein (isoleucine patch superfamily)